jgi:streptogramin lyase
VGGVAPTNTIQLALNLAKNPTLGLSLFTQGTPSAPFQPTLGTTTAPTSWTIAISYTFTSLDPTPNTPKGIAIDPGGYVYSVGAGNSNGTNYNTLQEVSPLTGSVIETHYTGNTIENQPSALAIDTLGNIWTTDSANNSLIESGPTAPAGGGGIHTGNNMSAPSAVAIDAAGNVWVTNKGNNSVSEFNSAGTAVGNFTSGIASPVAIAVDPK